MQFLRSTIPLYLLLVVETWGESSSNLKVKTNLGKVQGITKEQVEGKPLDVFLGIPYAAPTSGRNRFAPPKEREPWNDVLDATSLPKPCYQVVSKEIKQMEFASSAPETEDCLKLNIWVPKPRPVGSAVMVWFHGGSFVFGSIDLDIYNGATLAALENIIVVSVNYRLSGFGFLYLNHPEAPGNVGLMDQAFALQWVQKNIKSFGGDPGRVTIFGESAGAASVGIHLLAPSSLDLFKNAILQSGSPNDHWATDTVETALANAILTAEKAGCPTQENNRQETVHCLQDLDAGKLAELFLSFSENPIAMIFKPIVDGKFLPNSPTNLLYKGTFCGDKNVITGHTAQDGSILIQFSGLEVKEDVTYSEEQITSIVSQFSENKKISALQLEFVKYMYTDWESNADDRIAARSQLVHFLTDRWFLCGSLNAADRMAAKGNKVFAYSFDHIREEPKSFMMIPKWMGSSHAGEIPFVFGHTLKDKSSLDIKMAKRMMRYWANFARKGDPNDDYLPTWPAYSPQQKLKLHFDGPNITVNKASRIKECAFWEHIFPKIGLPANE